MTTSSKSLVGGLGHRTEIEPWRGVYPKQAVVHEGSWTFITMEDPKPWLQYEMWWPAYSRPGVSVTASYPGYSCHSLRVIGVTAGDTARQAFFSGAGFSCSVQAMIP